MTNGKKKQKMKASKGGVPPYQDSQQFYDSAKLSTTRSKTCIMLRTDSCFSPSQLLKRTNCIWYIDVNRIGFKSPGSRRKRFRILGLTRNSSARKGGMSGSGVCTTCYATPKCEKKKKKASINK